MVYYFFLKLSKINFFNGVDDGIRTHDPRATIWCSNLLSYTHTSKIHKFKELKMVGVKGLEPSTPWSQTRCATRLRYTPSFRSCDYIKLFPLCQEKSKQFAILSLIKLKESLDNILCSYFLNLER